MWREGTCFPYGGAAGNTACSATSTFNKGRLDLLKRLACSCFPCLRVCQRVLVFMDLLTNCSGDRLLERFQRFLRPGKRICYCLVSTTTAATTSPPSTTTTTITSSTATGTFPTTGWQLSAAGLQNMLKRGRCSRPQTHRLLVSLFFLSYQCAPLVFVSFYCIMFRPPCRHLCLEGAPATMCVELTFATRIPWPE